VYRSLDGLAVVAQELKVHQVEVLRAVDAIIKSTVDQWPGERGRCNQGGCACC